MLRRCPNVTKCLFNVTLIQFSPHQILHTIDPCFRAGVYLTEEEDSRIRWLGCCLDRRHLATEGHLVCPLPPPGDHLEHLAAWPCYLTGACGGHWAWNNWITPPSFLKCHQPGIMRWGVWWPSDEIIASGYNWTIRAVKTSQTEAIIRRFDCKQNATQDKGAAPLPLLIRQSPADFKDGSERGESVTVRKRFLET